MRATKLHKILVRKALYGKVPDELAEAIGRSITYSRVLKKTDKEGKVTFTETKITLLEQAEQFVRMVESAAASQKEEMEKLKTLEAEAPAPQV